MRQYTLLIIFSFGVGLTGFGQRLPMESAFLLGYQKYFPNKDTSGFFNIGYSAFFEKESMYAVTTRSRFNASLMTNPFTKLYGLQVGGSYSYILMGGAQINVIQKLPYQRVWQANISPFIGLDIWFFTFHVGRNIQIELQPPLTPPPPPLAKWHYSLNAYIPLKKNKRMYR